ncbi:4'-phosphopantetheinyl transferase superfamily protein [Thermomonas sp. HDW16]|uniref:4'-phosphopantetheinyl transferase family protein n=1 Tax=Thermomonas sp. HDW16 TaxID=2714945 RepID=UPI00140BABC4|nr:4'-phosphopantetheinyl transferase superfamily protein [Thermomonas sp. HDW16]QIL19548.1 4'-phosphopantetheinyl transferase superfamily protein [Thermomonas sp. HDW16]
MTATPLDFAIGALQCRWHAMPAHARAQDIATGWLRDVAGDTAADGLHRDARGRPRLAQGDISWSHSHGRLLIAYAASGRLGIDAESRTRHANPLRIARRFFATEEVAVLEALDGDARQFAFLRMWCAKEAVLKADGRGIAFGLEKLVFDTAGDGLRMLRCDPALGRIEDWRLHLIAPEPDYIAVLAATD